jgi:hypothetical protein
MSRAFSSLVIVATALTSCSSPALKAPPANVSSFLKSKPALKDVRPLSPFAMSGGDLATGKRKIYIAPVSLSYLRGPSKSLVKESAAAREKAARELAEYAREQFVQAFQKSPAPRFVVQREPGPDCVTLELALTELNPNTFTGAVTRFAVNNLAFPGTDAILAKATRGLKGDIAIEGKVGAPEVIYQFADHEESKSALLLPVTDFSAYGQAREAIREWAKQFELLTRSAPGKPVKDSSAISLF